MLNMNKEEIIKYCLTLENTFKDCPFPDDFESVTMKHCKNKKWFALIMNVNNKLYLNVKTDPNYSDILRNFVSLQCLRLFLLSLPFLFRYPKT